MFTSHAVDSSTRVESVSSQALALLIQNIYTTMSYSYYHHYLAIRYYRFEYSEHIKNWIGMLKPHFILIAEEERKQKKSMKNVGMSTAHVTRSVLRDRQSRLFVPSG